MCRSSGQPAVWPLQRHKSRVMGTYINLLLLFASNEWPRSVVQRKKPKSKILLILLVFSVPVGVHPPALNFDSLGSLVTSVIILKMTVCQGYQGRGQSVIGNWTPTAGRAPSTVGTHTVVITLLCRPGSPHHRCRRKSLQAVPG
jgi:hypothetical protein